MDIRTKLNNHISGSYRAWVDYASRYVRRSKLPIEPSEVVDDILCTLLEGDLHRLERLMDSPLGGRTELDFMVMKIIKTAIYSPRSPFRYKRGEHCTGQLRENMQIANDDSESIGVDLIYSLAWSALSELNISEFSKRVFIWKFFDRKSISKWPGRETQRTLYRSYNGTLKKIYIHIRGKIEL